MCICPKIAKDVNVEKSRFGSRSRDFCQIFEGFGFGFGKKVSVSVSEKFGIVKKDSVSVSVKILVSSFSASDLPMLFEHFRTKLIEFVDVPISCVFSGYVNFVRLI